MAAAVVLQAGCGLYPMWPDLPSKGTCRNFYMTDWGGNSPWTELNCVVCGEEIPGRYEHRGPPRTVCLSRRCETRRDAARRALRATQEARP